MGQLSAMCLPSCHHVLAGTALSVLLQSNKQSAALSS